MKTKRIMLLGGVFLLSITFVSVALAMASGSPRIQPQASVLSPAGGILPADVLLVDNDNNDPNSVVSYTEALDALGYSYLTWDTSVFGEPTLTETKMYRAVIWFSGDAYAQQPPPIAGPSPAAENDLAQYLDTYDGCFMISSQDYVYDRGATPFIINYLGVLTATDSVGQSIITGTNSYTGFGPYFLNFPISLSNYTDAFTLTADGTVAFWGDGGFGGIGAGSDGRSQNKPEGLAGLSIAGASKETSTYFTTFLGFPLEAIPSAFEREQVIGRFMRNCLSEDILVVSDDDDAPDVTNYYTQTLDGMGYSYDVWDVQNSDNIEPGPEDLIGYEAVVWFSGDARSTFSPTAGPNPQTESVLASWLEDSDACFMISSQDYLTDNGLTPFMTNYLGIASGTNDVSQAVVTGTQIYGGLGPFSLSYPFSLTTSDAFDLTPGAVPAFIGNQFTISDSQVAGSYLNQNGYQTTYLGFPLEALPGPLGRRSVMQRFLANCFETDLQVEKFTSNPVVNLGQSFIYTVLVHNNGPSRAVDVIVSDFAPKGVVIKDVFSSIGSCNTMSNPINHVTCVIPELGVGEVAAIDIQVIPFTPGSLTNFVFATNHGADPVPTNNSTSRIVQVLPAGFTAPIINKVEPNFFSNQITNTFEIFGANFVTGTKVFINDTELSLVTFHSEDHLSAGIPAGQAVGPYSVKVENPNNEFDMVLKALFVYDPNELAIDAVVPALGPNDRPVFLNIFGDGFSPGMTVELIDSSNPANSEILDNAFYISETLIRANAPFEITPGLYDVRLYNPSNISVTLPSSYEAIDGFTMDDLFAMGFDLFTIPASPREGDEVQVGLTVRRRTGEAAPLFTTPVNVSVTLSVESAGLNGPDIGLGGTGVISANSTLLMTFPWTFEQAGAYTVSVQITSPDLVTDTLPANNQATRIINVLPPSSDSTPPEVTGLTIDNGAPITTDQEVLLNTTATDAGSGVAYVYYIEYVFDRNLGDWIPINQSGWKPFAAASEDFEWILEPVPGTHYLQAWVSDQKGNISAPLLASINFIPVKGIIPHNGGQIFRLDLTAGQQIQINLTSLTGDVDMFVWGPDGSLVTVAEGFTSLEEVVFTAPLSGEYQVDILGFEASSYWFEVTELTSVLVPDSPDEVSGHLKGSDQPLLVIGNDPADDNGVPQATGTSLYLPLIYR